MSRDKETPVWDHSSHERFYGYYAEGSQSQVTLDRFRSIRDRVLSVARKSRLIEHTLDVADIGCGAGSQCMMWAELGHHGHGLDVSESLVELARERAASAGYVIDFQVGSAVELPWADESMDVCLLPELLEHVAEWERCLNECVRILRPSGVLFIATTNKLCPIQQEFNLPLYSWYPSPVKRYFERLAVTTRPELANFAKYPAVNWFSFYKLRAVLAARGLQCLDRFDVMDLANKSPLRRFIVSSLRAVPLLRWLAHVATPSTLVVAVKRGIGVISGAAQ